MGREEIPMKNTKQLFVLFLLVMFVALSFPVSVKTAFGQLQSTTPAPAPAAPIFTPAPAPIPATPNDGSIKGYFLANNGGVDFSINPDDPGGDGEEDRPNYAGLASIMSATRPTPTDQIRAAETNTDIDVRVIRDAAKESIGDLIFFRTYLAFGDTEAARFHSEKISRQMIDVQMEVGFVIPLEQMQLIESESPTAEEDLSNSGQRFLELEQQEQEAIEAGSIPANPTYTTLNASDIYELARGAREDTGGMAATATIFNDVEETTFLANQMADRLLTIYYSTNNFAVPLEQVQVIGSTAPNIEELKQAVLQFGD